MFKWNSPDFEIASQFTDLLTLEWMGPKEGTLTFYLWVCVFVQ